MRSLWFRLKIMASAGAVLALAAPPTAQAGELIKLSSLSWPPYNGPELANGGSNTAKLRSLLKRAGYDLDVSFLPWKRAVKYGLERKEYLGYFPEYYREDKNCLWSKQFDTSVVGFVEAASDSLSWSTVLPDLKSYDIGVVSGYANDNGPFDAAMNAGELNTQDVSKDLFNVKKVALGRIDAAVIDKKVLQHLLETKVPHLKDKVKFDETPLTKNGLFVCFQPDYPKAKEVRNALNAVIEDRGVDDPEKKGSVSFLPSPDGAALWALR